MVNLYKTLSTKGTLFAFLLGLVIMVIFAIPVIGGLTSFNALPAEDQNTSNIFNTGLYLMLILLAIAVVLTILWAIVLMALNPSGAKQGLIWVVVIVALFAIGYYVLNEPDNQAILGDLKTNDVTPSMSKLIGGSLWMMILMLFASVLIFIGSEVRNIFK